MRGRDAALRSETPHSAEVLSGGGGDGGGGADIGHHMCVRGPCARANEESPSSNTQCRSNEKAPAPTLYIGTYSKFRKKEETPAKITAKGQAHKKRVLVALMGQGSSMLAAPGIMRMCDVYTDH